MAAKQDERARVAVAGLIEDASLYPRFHVDETHVANLARALEVGDQLPPPLVDRATSKIIDGWHRVRAFTKVFGEGSIIEVTLRDYSDDPARMVADAVEANAGHGRGLGSRDRTRALLMLREAGFDLDYCARILHTTSRRVEELRARIAVVAFEERDEIVAAKQVAWPRPESGPRRLTPEQARAMESFSGLRPTQQVRQLRDGLNTGLIDLDDGKVVEALRELLTSIQEAFEREGVVVTD